jgi:hypothetical protein
MPFSIDDNLDPNDLPLGTNIRQAINILATQIKQLSGKQTWRTKPDYSIATAIKGEKGDKGDPGESAPNHQHQITDISGLQTALDSKAAIGHEHQLGLWQDISLASAWSNYASGSAVPRCRKLMGNLIEVRGTIKKASSASANEIVATLPVGYRPTETSYFITWAGNGYCRLQIDSSGIVKVNITGSNGSASLNFIFGLE